MIRVYVICEGQTEEEFVRHLLAPALTLFPAYDKPEHPLFAALDIGLDSIRRECLLFDAWVKRLEELNTGGEA